jgi:TRAP-type transport system periplasmic protein
MKKGGSIMTILVNRRSALLIGAAAGATIATPWIARAAPEFSLKYANNVPVTHPLNVRAKEAMDRIKTQTNGRVEIEIFPNNQLGSDTDMLSQLRSGAIEFFTLSGLILSTLVPVASINGIGFAWTSYDQVWPAMDGGLGAYIRAQIQKAGLHAMEQAWDNGFRQITSSTRPIKTPDDLKGFKIRVPPSPLWTSMFEAFDAAPTGSLFRAADQGGRGAGKSARGDFLRQAFRGAEVSLADQPHVGRLLVPGERQGVAGASRRRARGDRQEPRPIGARPAR